MRRFALRALSIPPQSMIPVADRNLKIFYLVHKTGDGSSHGIGEVHWDGVPYLLFVFSLKKS